MQSGLINASKKTMNLLIMKILLHTESSPCVLSVLMQCRDSRVDTYHLSNSTLHSLIDISKHILLAHMTIPNFIAEGSNC